MEFPGAGSALFLVGEALMSHPSRGLLGEDLAVLEVVSECD
jgi:hypothetical protein